MRFLFSFLVILSMVMVTLGVTGCAGNEAESPEELELATDFPFNSSAFGNGEIIPIKYTGDGLDISPPLQWSEPPQNTQSFALISDDPDCSGSPFDHWVLYNIPAETRELPEGIPPDADLADGSHQGKKTVTESWVTSAPIHPVVFTAMCSDFMPWILCSTWLLVPASLSCYKLWKVIF